MSLRHQYDVIVATVTYLFSSLTLEHDRQCMRCSITVSVTLQPETSDFPQRNIFLKSFNSKVEEQSVEIQLTSYEKSQCQCFYQLWTD